ncbi:MAG: phospholipase D-like domain-containing protein [Methylotenera sp.]
MDGLYTNRNSLSDFVKNGILSATQNAMDIYIAVAFFTEADVVQEIASNNCHIRMIVRLGFPTNPFALRKLMSNANIEIRYYTSPSFHPKLYIFGDQIALVGSANLTGKAILSNQEVVVSVNSSDERFNELASLFSDYWNEASVLNTETLDDYEKIYSKYMAASKVIDDINNELLTKLGDVVFSNINRGLTKKSNENIFIDSYRKTYQESVTAYNQVQKIYQTFGQRKVEEGRVPLRLEIDSFFSFVRDKHATHEKWRETPLGWNSERESNLRQLIDEWLNIEWKHFDIQIAEINYPLIKRVFASPDSINAASMEEIVEALVVLHSFHDRLRFFDGGLETLKKAFASQNDLNKVKTSIKHLIFGKGDTVKRMSDLIYDPSFKINQFGQSNVQELVGWINNDNIPVINGRTTKVLRYFGFDVRQL